MTKMKGTVDTINTISTTMGPVETDATNVTTKVCHRTDNIMTQTETNATIETKQAHTTKNKFNIIEHDFTVSNNKHLKNERNTLQDKESSYSYDIDYVECWTIKMLITAILMTMISII